MWILLVSMFLSEIAHEAVPSCWKLMIVSKAVVCKSKFLRLEDTYAARHMKIRPPLHVCLNNSHNRVFEGNVQGGSVLMCFSSINLVTLSSAIFAKNGLRFGLLP